MTSRKNDFRLLAQAIFGGGWQTAAAKYLCVNGSTVRRWVGKREEYQPPESAIDALAKCYAEKIFQQIYGNQPWTETTDKLIKQHMADMLPPA
jgi:transposase